MKRAILAALLFCLSTPAHAQLELPNISTWDLMMTTCQLMPPGTPGGDKWPCTCNGVFHFCDGSVYCTPSGWQPMVMTDPALCPARVSNGQSIPSDGVCGNAETDPHGLIPQSFGGVSFPDWGCIEHDRCYGDCSQAKSTCDDNIKIGITAGCESYYPRNMDFSFANRARRRTCVDVGARLIYQAVNQLGQGSYNRAQINACQCGPQGCPSDCNGGVVLCLFFNQPGCSGFVPIIGLPPPGSPPFNPPGPLPPGADF
jgi:hypothetical protein